MYATEGRRVSQPTPEFDSGVTPRRADPAAWRDLDGPAGWARCRRDHAPSARRAAGPGPRGPVRGGGPRPASMRSDQPSGPEGPRDRAR